MNVPMHTWTCPDCGKSLRSYEASRVGLRCSHCIQQVSLRYSEKVIRKATQERLFSVRPKPPAYAGPKTYNMVT